MKIRKSLYGIAAIVALTFTASASAAMMTFSNTDLISIPASGNATPFPSEINVSGVGSSATGISVSIFGLTHTAAPSDLEMYLVAPGGTAGVQLLNSDGGSFANATNVDLIFLDGAAAVPDPLVSGTYAPEGAGGSGAPPLGIVYGASLNALLGGNVDGTWGLYVDDTTFLDGGQIAGGWSITFDVPDNGVIPEPGTMSLLALGGLALVALRRRKQ